MATANQQSFAATYGPYAQQAGTKLGVDPNIILGQWGMETGWQTPASGNLAGISPGGKLASYSSPQAFTDAYTSTISNNFPGAVGAGSNAQTFNNGLVNGTYGSYYQGNDAASKGLTVPTAYDQSSYANSLTSSQNSNLIQYSSGSAPSSSTTLANTGNTSGQGFGSSYQTYDPQTGLYSDGSGDQSLSPFTTVDASGNISTNPIASGSGVGGYNTTTGSGVTQPGYSSGEITTDPTTGYTSIPGTSTSASPSSNPSFGGDQGYIPPASTGGPFTLGLASGVVGSINTWVTGAETAVGNWMTKSLGDMFSSAVNWFARAGLILLGFILLAFALWRLLDPSGEKTKGAMANMAEVAA